VLPPVLDTRNNAHIGRKQAQADRAMAVAVVDAERVSGPLLFRRQFALTMLRTEVGRC
jgi:hypothetical protein